MSVEDNLWLTSVCRVLGHVAFRNSLLERYGTVVSVPYKHKTGSMDGLAADIRAGVEGKTRLPLEAFGAPAAQVRAAGMPNACHCLCIDMLEHVAVQPLMQACACLSLAQAIHMLHHLCHLSVSMVVKWH